MGWCAEVSAPCLVGYPERRRRGHGGVEGVLIRIPRRTIRLLCLEGPLRNAVLLIAGDKSGQWNQWYRQAIPLAEQWYEAYLKELP
jgi:Phage derived protein Gp49-like (DUF891)